VPSLLPEDVQRWLLTGLDHTILVTDENLTVVGDPILEWTVLDCTLKFNEPGSGMFVCPGYPWIREQIQAGNRIVVLRNRQVLMAGPFESLLYERSDDGQNAGDGTLTVHFSDDLANVVARCTYANPALAAGAQTTDNWVYTGNAELALRAAVNLNAGPGALVARQVPSLILGALASVGSSITLKADRMEPLGEVLRRGALVGGGLGFRTHQVGTDIEFQVYDPPDVSGSVRFSFGLGNLRYVGYERTAPSATVAIVGGQGEGADRLVLERINATGVADWGRLELLVPRPGNTPTAELNEDGDQALADADDTVRLQTAALDTYDQRFGIHYGLGDRVAIEPWQGLEIADPVMTVHLQAWPTAGEVVSSTIGSQAASADSAYIRRLREIDRRVGRLERGIAPVATIS
jgi:hypothetical protein